MRKKFLAFMLATSMVLTAAPAAANLGTAVASAEEAVVATNEATTAVAEATVDTIGATDKTTNFWGAFSKNHYKLTGDFDASFKFNNFGNAENYNNYVMAFTNEDAVNDGTQSADYKEYAIVRADSWGWGGGDNMTVSGNAITYTSTCPDWDTFKEIMQSASVDMNVKRSGSDVTITAHIVSLKDETKAYDYTVNFTETSDDMYLSFTVDHSYMQLYSVKGTNADFEAEAPVVASVDTIGATDKTTGFWSAFSKKHYKLAGDFDASFKFNNYGNAENYNNYVMAFTNEDAVNDGTQSADYKEYAIVRADSWGWGGGDNMTVSGNAITYTSTCPDWDTFKDIMQAASVDMNVKRSGSDVTITAHIVSLKDAAKAYDYTVNFTETSDDMYLSFTVDHSYMQLYSVKGTNADFEAEAPATEVKTDDGKTTTDDSKTTAAKKKMTVKVTAKTGAKKVTGTVSVAKATVKVKVGSAAYKKATVKGKKFTLKTSKLKKGTKVVVKVTKSGYKTVTKNVKVK